MKIDRQIALKQDPQTRTASQEEQLHKAASMYEEHFLGEMVKAMRTTVHREDGFVKPNMAENIFSEQLDQQYIEGWTKKGGIGLGDMIYNQLHERIFPNKKDFSKPAGPIPFDKSKGGFQIKVDKTDLKQGQVTFRGDNASPLVQSTPVQSPWSGQIASAQTGDGWSHVSILHDNQLRSDLAFQGPLGQLKVGEKVGAGDAIGLLALDSPTLRWQVSELT
jgi:flagellar protein FlgJ